MTSSLDLATALDHVLGDPNTEAKFQALKTLHAKKIKSLMSSIDSKERDLDRMKALGKDNRRTEIIQSLKKKLKHHELVINVMKEELVKKAEMTYEEVNQFVIGKTISGPKRFRPLIREELENTITDLERKLELERKMRAKMTASATAATSAATGGGGGGGGSGTKQTPTKGVKNSASGGGGAHTGTGSNGGAEKRAVSEEDLHKMIDISDLQDQIRGLNQDISSRDEIISKQKEEMARIRASNAALHSLEEEVDSLDRSYKELALVHRRTIEDLEESVHQVSAGQEERFQLQAEAEQEAEQAQLESENLREQCQKGLKQNAQLLRLMASLESRVHSGGGGGPSNAASCSPARGGGRGGTSAGSPARPGTASHPSSESSAEHTRLTEKLKTATSRIQELERGVAGSDAALLALRETLREKNEVIRDLKRNITEISRHNAVVGSGSGSGSGGNGHGSGNGNGRSSTSLDLSAEAKPGSRDRHAPPSSSPRDSKGSKGSPRA
jgi:hypothetical protein